MGTRLGVRASVMCGDGLVETGEVISGLHRLPRQAPPGLFGDFRARQSASASCRRHRRRRCGESSGFELPRFKASSGADQADLDIGGPDINPHRVDQRHSHPSLDMTKIQAAVPDGDCGSATSPPRTQTQSHSSFLPQALGSATLEG